MIRVGLYTSLFGWFLIANVTVAQEKPHNTAKPGDALLLPEKSVGAKMDYLLFLPQEYEKSQKKWPVLLYLHGSGECGTNLNLLKRNGPTKYVLTHPEFPFILVAPQTKGGFDDRAVVRLLDQIVNRYRVESRQVYLTGLSMGGGATWDIAAKHPERFAAVVPVSGVGNTGMANKLAVLPIWVFHGSRDNIISVEWSQKMVAAIKAAGGTIKYTEFPKSHHNIWAKVYDNPEMYQWLLAQKRRSK
ncbi:MAG: phospholipase/carboxylesterase [Verrucomicrobiales bacterium]|nr:phospholipase/carboxylesterase [Verrucomicrobiales bacterium]